MPPPPPAAPPVLWTIQSVAVRARDGPQRLDHAYRLLLDAPTATHRPADTPSRPADERDGKEPCHARRDLCPRLD